MAFLAAWPLILHGGREGRRETESKKFYRRKKGEIVYRFFGIARLSPALSETCSSLNSSKPKETGT